METENRPNAALINREWFDSAASILNRQELGLMLVKCVEYVFGIETRYELKGTAEVVFKMVRPALDSDINKYRERCARNAANARSQWQRVAASGSESQRVAANTTTTPTPTTTTTSTLSLDEDKAKKIEIEKWLIFGYFWSSGSRAVKEELTAFWSYYEALGWKNNKGAEIVNKLAAARMWRRQYETGTAPDGAVVWFKALQECSIPDYNAWHIYAGAERTESGALVRLRCSKSFLKSLQEAVPTLERTLKAAWRVQEVTFETLPDPAAAD